MADGEIKLSALEHMLDEIKETHVLAVHSVADAVQRLPAMLSFRDRHMSGGRFKFAPGAGLETGAGEESGDERTEAPEAPVAKKQKGKKEKAPTEGPKKDEPPNQQGAKGRRLRKNPRRLSP